MKLLYINGNRHCDVENLDSNKLFPNLKKKKGEGQTYSDSFSGIYAHYIKNSGIKEKWSDKLSSKTCFHSFRHNFKDELVKIEAPENIRRELMGHSDGSVHAIYGSQTPITVLFKWLDRVGYIVI